MVARVNNSWFHGFMYGIVLLVCDVVASQYVTNTELAAQAYQMESQ